MPDRETRRAVARLADPSLSEKDADRYAEVTAGLKSIQIQAILTPPPASEEDRAEREADIAGILGARQEARVRVPRRGLVFPDGKIRFDEPAEILLLSRAGIMKDCHGP